MKAIQTLRRIALLAVLAVAALSFASAASALPPVDPGRRRRSAVAAAEAEPRHRPDLRHARDDRERLGHQLHGRKPGQCGRRRVPRLGGTGRRRPDQGQGVFVARRGRVPLGDDPPPQDELLHRSPVHCRRRPRRERVERDRQRPRGGRPYEPHLPDPAEVQGEGGLVPCERRDRHRPRRLRRAVLDLLRRRVGRDAALLGQPRLR